MSQRNPDLTRFSSPSTYELTRLPVENATTLPPETYRSADYHTLESDKVFGKAWTCVGYTCQLDKPGKVITTTLSGQPLMVTRDKDGILRGFYNVCRHRGSLLVLEDSTKVERFRCPYHSWTYDLKGNLLNCPLFAMAGACKSSGGPDGSGKDTFNKEDYALLPVRVEAWGAFVFANLDPNPEPLSDYLGDFCSTYANFPLDELILVRRKKYNIAANWKLIAENFLEYYHLPWVHPELTGVTAIELHKRNQGSGMYMSFYASPLQSAGTAIDADYLPAMPRLTPDEQQSGYFPFVFPNMAMFLMPHHLFVLLMNPTSSGTTEEYGDILVHPSVLSAPNADNKIDEIFKFYDMVNLQDIMAVERVQKGIQSKPYPGGRMSYRFEEPVHRFQNMVVDYMTGEKRVYAGD
jgi:choline monooxygenase